MAAIDFPASSTNGQLFAAANGVTYRYATPPGIWTVANGPADTVIAADTPPSNPVPNQLWFHSMLGQLFIFFDDGSSQQWIPANPVPTIPAPVVPAIKFAQFYLSTTNIAVGTTAAIVNWNAPGENTTGGTYSGGTFTVPAGLAGVWDVDMFCQMSQSGNTYGVVCLFVNGVQTHNTILYIGSVTPGEVILSGKFRFAAGDAISCRVFANVAGVMYGTNGGFRNSWMHLTWLGP